VPDIASSAKRLLLGRPMRSEHVESVSLPKRLALPVFASDALSSVAYAPDEILLTLAVAGVTATAISPWIGVAVAVVMLTVVGSCRQNVRAYPSGGGDYEVATTNLGPTAGVTVGSALLVDYVLTVAVSVSSGVQYAASAVPALRGHQVVLAVAVIVALALVNLRGVRESGKVFAVPVYLFIAAIGIMAVVGVVRLLAGDLPMSESAAYDLVPQSGFEQGLVGIGGVFLVARAFASGAAALTGVEAISNGVPSFRKPKSRNAGITLALLGTISVGMLMAILLLARRMGVKIVDDPTSQLTLDGVPATEAYVQHPVIGQLAKGVFSGFPTAFYVVSAVTGIILVFAANTAFNGFPILGSILARDGFLPRQLRTRGDRLSFSNGILLLAGVAVVLVIVFDASVTRLIQLYIVGVFVSFTLSQLGMVRHWTRHLRTTVDRKERFRMMRSRVVNAFGFALTATVLLIVLITKFTHGAWLAVLLMAGTFALMKSIRRHYDAVVEQVDLADDDVAAERVLPSRVHAIVLVSRLHKPTMRALAYARAARPSVLEAVTVSVDSKDAVGLMRAWDEKDIPVPLRVLDSPYREITRPVLQYVRSIRRASPRDIVTVYIPEYVVGHWWEQVLHNQSALRLKGRLLFMPGVVVASVPWQMESARRQIQRRKDAHRTARAQEAEKKTGSGHPGSDRPGAPR